MTYSGSIALSAIFNTVEIPYKSTSCIEKQVIPSFSISHLKLQKKNFHLIL